MELMRLDKPIGSWLLFWPGAWSIALACHNQCSQMNWKLLFLFGVGSMMMRGAGCTINDLWDRHIDAKVERTKVRPLPSGNLNVKQALVFLGGQLSVGLVILLQLNWNCVMLGCISMVPVIIYPLMKRITNWPQLFLGFTFNFGVLMGWTAQVGSLDAKIILPLYFSGICWTLVYDTIYALQDIKDDLKININSTAIYFAEKVKMWLSLFAATSTSMLVWTGMNNAMGGIYYASVVGVAVHFAWQIWSLKKDDVLDCLKKFKSNRWLGGILFVGIFGDWALKRVSNSIVDLITVPSFWL